MRHCLRIQWPIKMLSVILLLITLLLVDPQIARAQRVALLPLADFSHGRGGIDGVNFPLTQALSEALVDQGFELVPEDAIEGVMVRNRIRSVGYLDAFLARKLGHELDCTHVFIGTVTDYREENGGALGLTLAAFDTATGGHVWGGTSAASAEESIRVFGVGESMGLQELQEQLFDDLLDGVATKIDRPAPQVANASYRLLDLQLSPQHLRGGESIDCRLEIDFLGSPPKGVALKNGERLVPLQPGAAPGSYHGTIISAMERGPYNVKIVLDWGNGQDSEMVDSLASYQVMNIPPTLDLTVHKGTQVGGVTLFRDHLVFIPVISGRHLMERWMIQIRSENNRIRISEEHLGNLPDRMVWYGKDRKGRKLEDGPYTFILKAWNAFGHQVEKSLNIAVQTTLASPNIEMIREKGRAFIKILPSADNVAPVIDWEIKVFLGTKEGILYKNGVSLPAMIQLPEEIDNRKIFCDLVTKDLLGNRLQLRNTRIEVSQTADTTGDNQFASISDAGWVDSF